MTLRQWDLLGSAVLVVMFGAATLLCIGAYLGWFS